MVEMPACLSENAEVGTVGTLLTHTHRWTVQSMGFQGLWVSGGWLKIAFKKSQKNQKKSEKNSALYITNLNNKNYALRKKSVKKVLFMPLVSSRRSCLLKVPNNASSLRAIGSSISSVYRVIVDVALRRSRRVG